MLFRLFYFLGVLSLTHAEVTRVRNSGRNVLYYSAPPKDWWKTATIYQIYPKSFKDSDGDGIGDLKGIREKLEYIQGLGVSAIWLTPIFASPLKDQGYDISDFRAINPQLGTLQDFKDLHAEAHKRGLKVILDFVPNHTSDQHEWFKKSASRTEGYEDYYVWADGKTVNGIRYPPNNWVSVFKGSAWEWHEGRQQYYLHQFLKEQPDLNYRNIKVRKELKDVLSYWLDHMDVDGVRIDAVPHLLEDEHLRDEPRSFNHTSEFSPDDYEFYKHIYTTNHNESFDLIYEWREHLDKISEKKGSTRIMMTEAAADIDYVVRYYGDEENDGAHFSFNFWMIGLSKDALNVKEIKRIITTWLEKLPEKFTLNWILGNHDNHRIASKAGEDAVDGLNMLTGFLPGIQVTYNGEEIGMEDGEVDCQHGQDFKDRCDLYKKMSRDFERTPFQWDNSTTAGFSTNPSTWLPVSPKKDKCNVKDEEASSTSHLKTYKEIEKLRQILGQLDNHVEITEVGKNTNVIQISRYNTSYTSDEPNGTVKYLTAYHYFFNMNNDNVSFTFEDKVEEKKYTAVVVSANSKISQGDTHQGELTLAPYEALILTTNRNRNGGTTLNAGILFIFAILLPLYNAI